MPVKMLQLARLGGRDKAILAEALLALVAASAAIAVAPFRKVVAFDVGPASPSGSDGVVARKCRWAVTAWADRVPWRAVCFQRGLALHWMLRRRGLRSILHYGVGRGPESRLRAHVWVSLDGETLLGGEVADQFACLATFPPPARD